MSESKKLITENARIVAIVLNFFVPSAGALVLGCVGLGIFQMFLVFIGAILSVFIVGFFILFVVWVWSIVIAVKAETKKRIKLVRLIGL